MARPLNPGPCADCGLVVRYKARGLCEVCYNRHRWAKTIDQFPKLPPAPPKPEPEDKSTYRPWCPSCDDDGNVTTNLVREGIAISYICLSPSHASPLYLKPEALVR